MSVKPGKLLRAEDLLQSHICNDRTLPKVGGKEVKPTGSWLERKQVQAALDESKQLLEEERVEKLGALAQADWNDKKKLAEVTKKVGKHWLTMGFERGGKSFLYPEEALYLLEMNCLELNFGGVPLSIQQAYSLLLCSATGCSLKQYRTYSHLTKKGYRLLRYKKPGTTIYEHQIRLDQVKSQKRVFPEVDVEEDTADDQETSTQDSVNKDDHVKEVCVDLVIEDVTNTDQGGQAKRSKKDCPEKVEDCSENRSGSSTVEKDKDVNGPMQDFAKSVTDMGKDLVKTEKGDGGEKMGLEDLRLKILGMLESHFQGQIPKDTMNAVSLTASKAILVHVEDVDNSELASTDLENSTVGNAGSDMEEDNTVQESSENRGSVNGEVPTSESCDLTVEDAMVVDESQKSGGSIVEEPPKESDCSKKDEVSEIADVEMEKQAEKNEEEFGKSGGVEENVSKEADEEAAKSSEGTEESASKKADGESKENSEGTKEASSEKSIEGTEDTKELEKGIEDTAVATLRKTEEGSGKKRENNEECASEKKEESEKIEAVESRNSGKISTTNEEEVSRVSGFDSGGQTQSEAKTSDSISENTENGDVPVSKKSEPKEKVQAEQTNAERNASEEIIEKTESNHGDITCINSDNPNKESKEGGESKNANESREMNEDIEELTEIPAAEGSSSKDATVNNSATQCDQPLPKDNEEDAEEELETEIEVLPSEQRCRINEEPMQVDDDVVEIEDPHSWKNIKAERSNNESQKRAFSDSNGWRTFKESQTGSPPSKKSKPSDDNIAVDKSEGADIELIDITEDSTAKVPEKPVTAMKKEEIEIVDLDESDNSSKEGSGSESDDDSKADVKVEKTVRERPKLMSAFERARDFRRKAIMDLFPSMHDRAIMSVSVPPKHLLPPNICPSQTTYNIHRRRLSSDRHHSYHVPFNPRRSHNGNGRFFNYFNDHRQNQSHQQRHPRFNAQTALWQGPPVMQNTQNVQNIQTIQNIHNMQINPAAMQAFQMITSIVLPMLGMSSINTPMVRQNSPQPWAQNIWQQPPRPNWHSPPPWRFQPRHHWNNNRYNRPRLPDWQNQNRVIVERDNTNDEFPERPNRPKRSTPGPGTSWIDNRPSASQPGSMETRRPKRPFRFEMDFNNRNRKIARDLLTDIEDEIRWKKMRQMNESSDSESEAEITITPIESSSKVRPLLKPDQCKNPDSILASVQVIERADPKVLNISGENRTLKISFDMFSPGTPFKKSSLPKPTFRLCIMGAEETVPSPGEVALLLDEIHDEVPVLFAIVHPDDISFYCWSTVDLPKQTSSS